MTTCSHVNVTDQNRDALSAAIRGMYEAEGCGICEKTGAEVFWFSPYSRCAHQRCVNIIELAEDSLEGLIGSIFEGARDCEYQNEAHIRAIRCVKDACGSDSIMSYMEKKGAKVLQHLFDTVGVKGVQDYIDDKLLDEDCRNDNRRVLKFELLHDPVLHQAAQRMKEFKTRH